MSGECVVKIKDITEGWTNVASNLGKDLFGINRNDTWTGKNGLVPGIGKYKTNRAQAAANAQPTATPASTTPPEQTAPEPEEVTGKNVPKLVKLKSGREGVQFQGKIYVTGDDGRWVVFGSNKPVGTDLQAEFDSLIGYKNTGGANTPPPPQPAASSPAQQQTSTEPDVEPESDPAPTTPPPTAKARISRKPDGSVTITDKNGQAWTKPVDKDYWSNGKGIFMPGSEQYNALTNFNKNLKEAGL